MKNKTIISPLPDVQIDKWKKYMPLLLAAFAFLLYANTIKNGYNMDDELVTRKHKLTSKGISAIPKIFNSPYYSDDMGYSYEYRPVVHASFAIEHQFFGDNASVSHFFNVLLYVLTVLLLFKLLRKLLYAYSYWYSVLAVLLFIVHPLHTEVVASIKNRDEILALLGALGAWWFALGFAEKGKWWQVTLAALFFLGAILSKMSTFPFLVFIPLSLVFFSTISERKLLLLSLLMAIPVYPFLPIPGKLQPLFLPIFVLAVFFPWICIRLMGRLSFKPKEIWQDLLNGLKDNLSYSNPDAENQTGSPFLLQPLLLKREELQKISFLSVFSALLVGCALYVWMPSGYILVGWFLLFGITFLTANHSQRNILQVVFTAMFLWVCFLSYHALYIDYGLSFLLFIYLLYKGHRNILSIICILAFAPFYFYFERPFDYFFALVLPFVVMLLPIKGKVLYRIFYYLIIAGIAILIVSTLLDVQKGGWESIIVGIVVYLLIILAMFRKGLKYMIPILLLACIPFFHLLKESYRPAELSQPSMVGGFSMADVQPNDTSFAAPSNNRPIQFAEFPVASDTPLKERMGLAADVMGFYLKKMVLPYPLGYYYGYAFFKPASIFSLWPMVSILIHISLLVLSFWLLKKHRLLTFGIWFYLVSVALFSGFFYPVVGVAGDRFSYMASIGFVMSVIYLLILITMKWDGLVKDIRPSKPLLAILGTVILIYGFISINRNTLWADQITLMSHDIEYLDESSQAHNLYALTLMRESFENKKLRPDQQLNMRKTAVLHFDKALQIWPDFFNAAYDKGRSASIIGDVNSAIDGYEKAINIGTEGGFIEPYIQLSQLYLQTGRYKDFLVNAKKLLEKDKKAEAFNAVARGFYLNGYSDSAKIYLRRGMVLNPGEVSLKKNMAEIFKAESKPDSMNYWLAQ